jgi:hypothetical protein
MNDWPEPTEPEPSLDELESMLMDIEPHTATDGCEIEPDGICSHGHPSWFLALGLI